MSNVVSFEEENSNVNCGHDASLNLTANLTICALLKNTRHSNYHIILGKCTDLTTPNISFLLYTQIYTGEIRFLISDGASSNIDITGYNLQLKRWNHVVAVLSAGFMKVYVNGFKVAADFVRTLNPQALPNMNVLVGGINGFGYSTPGQFAHASVYNRDLSDDEVRYNYEHPGNPKRRGLALNLTQESIYGAQWVDLSGNGNHGTYSGGANLAYPMRANLVTQR